MKSPNGTPPMIQVRRPDTGVSWSVPQGVRAGDVPGIREAADGFETVAALVNNDVVTLEYPLEVDSEVTPLTLRHAYGWRVYRNSVCFLLARAMHELYPEVRFSVEHSLGPGFYCSAFFPDGNTLGPERLLAVEAKMREWVALDEPIVRKKIAFESALKRFEEARQEDKYNLLRYKNPPKITVYACGPFTDLAHNVLADRTGALTHFALVPYEEGGFVVLFPEREGTPQLGPFDPQPHLFRILSEHKEWGRILGLRTAGDLNRMIADGDISDLVRIAEGLHEKKIARLADTAAEHRKRVRLILIAGPSSSGKTTFTKRLAVQLRVNGLQPQMLSVDDYFVNRDVTPRDAAGRLDYEHIETVDLALLQRDLRVLMKGGEIQLPSFNFENGEREYRGRTLKLGPEQVLIVEGIHALNPRLTECVSARNKFRIYISALTQLNLDRHNRISTTDVRLMRRMVRDHQFRGNDAVRTMEMWPGVRNGEKAWIFPFQREADATFNSALDYELAVLKPFAEPLLRSIKPWHSSYADARRLLAFLDIFLTQSPSMVPPNSILREFIGRSSFHYD